MFSESENPEQSQTELKGVSEAGRDFGAEEQMLSPPLRFITSLPFPSSTLSNKQTTNTLKIIVVAASEVYYPTAPAPHLIAETIKYLAMSNIGDRVWKKKMKYANVPTHNSISAFDNSNN